MASAVSERPVEAGGGVNSESLPCYCSRIAAGDLAAVHTLLQNLDARLEGVKFFMERLNYRFDTIERFLSHMKDVTDTTGL